MSEQDQVPTSEEFTRVTTLLPVLFPEFGGMVAGWLKSLPSEQIQGLSWAAIMELPGAPFHPGFMMDAINETLL